MRTKIVITLVVLSLSVLMVRGGKRLWGPQGHFVEDKKMTLKSKGDPSAPVWVVEYVDMQCQSCRIASQVMEDYTRWFPEQIYLQIKFFPLRNHQHSFESARFVECASRQGQFWPFFRMVFDHQEEWSSLPAIRETFMQYARTLGLKTSELGACVDDPKTQELLTAEKAAAESVGINLTPTFFFNGQMTTGRQAFIEALDYYFPDGRRRMMEETS